MRESVSLPLIFCGPAPFPGGLAAQGRKELSERRGVLDFGRGEGVPLTERRGLW
jgi:hypothetical protein